MPQQPEDRRYFEARIENELALARSAAHPEAARAHSVLAGLYAQRLKSVTEPALSGGVRT